MFSFVQTVETQQLEFTTGIHCRTFGTFFEMLDNEDCVQSGDTCFEFLFTRDPAADMVLSRPSRP